MRDLFFFYQCELRSRIVQLQRHIPALKVHAKYKSYGSRKVLPTEDGRRVLIEAIQKGAPFMAARFGTTEGRILHEYWKHKMTQKGTYKQKYVDEMCINAGFFPGTVEYLDKWAEMETDACKDVDMLGVMNFLGEEWITRKFCSKATLMLSSGLASAANGWAWALEGKKVLVVHPFTETIEKQYNYHREEIFPGTNALPLFHLQCVKAVQTIADQDDDRFENWFEALDYMTEEIAKHDFDIALIGCGAYGFQLASRVKRMGKIAIHMGGPLQTLFGIKGGRWDKSLEHLYNDFWVYPSDDEVPAGFEKVENGCYWGNKK